MLRNSRDEFLGCVESDLNTNPKHFWSILKLNSKSDTIPDRVSTQSRTQSPQAFWSAGRRQERLWDNGISYPRKSGIPVFVRMLKIKTEVKCPKMAVVLMFSGLKVLSGLEGVRESQS